MSTDTAEQTVSVITYELRVSMQVDVPVERLQMYDTPLEDLGNDEILDIISEDTDLVPDALQAIFEKMDFTTAYVDVDTWEGPHEIPVLEGVKLYKPEGLYTLPVPNLISGNVVFTDEGIEPVEVSNVNVLTDDQLEGAYYATKRVWGLRGMHRYQKEQIGEFLSELQWAMLARPSRHVFKSGDGDPFDTPLCSYCGNREDGHLVRDE